MLQKLTVLAQYLIGQIEGNAYSLAGVAATFVAFWAVGRLFLGPGSGSPALFGWAVTYFVSLVAASLGFNDLRLVAILLLILCVAAVWLKRRELLPDADSRMGLLLVAPIAALGLLMPLLHWDSFWHWVLNGSYLDRFDRFPAVPLDGFPSFHPMYPEATSLVFYLASLVTARFAETAGTYLNVALTLVALVTVAKLLRQVLAGQQEQAAPTAVLRLGLPVVAFCIVLSLHPSFRSINYFSAITDPLLGVLVLVLVIQWCNLVTCEPHAARSGGSIAPGPVNLRDSARDLLFLFMLGVLISGVKHSGWVLAVLLSICGVFAAMFQGISWRRWLAPALSVMAGSLVAQLLWTRYLAANLPVPGQFSIKPFDEWRFDLLPGLMQGVLADFGTFPAYYALVVLTVLAGLVALVRPSFAGDRRFSLMLAMVSVAMLGHFCILLLAYLATGFPVPEILRAASLQRYSSHVGYAVGVLGLVALVARLFPLAAGRFRRLDLRVLALAALGVYTATFALNVVLPSLRVANTFRETYQPRRELAAQVMQAIPPGETFTVFASEWLVNFISYESWRPLMDSQGPVFKGRKIVESAADLESARQHLAQWMADVSVNHILLIDAEVLAVDLGLPNSRNLVWSRSTQQWQPL